MRGLDARRAPPRRVASPCSFPSMASVGRYVRMTAKEGKGEQLAQVMLRVAEGLQSVPGCELYLVNRSAAEPDVVWVTELWLSQDAVDASLQALQNDEGKAQLVGPRHPGDGKMDADFWPA